MKWWFVIGWVSFGTFLPGCSGRKADLGVEQLRDELMAVRERNRMLKDEIAVCGVDPAPPGLLAELNQVLSSVGCRVHQRGHATIVTLTSDQVFNDPFNMRLREDADARLDLLATALLLHPELSVAVVGYTGDSPFPRAYEREFSTHRQQSLAMADRLARHLETHYEIPTHRLIVAGRGNASPVEEVGDGTADPNYRIEIMLYRTGDPPPGPQ